MGAFAFLAGLRFRSLCLSSSPSSGGAMTPAARVMWSQPLSPQFEL